MSKPLQLGLIGLGTVGVGVFETLCRNHDLLEARAQISYEIKRVAVRDLTRQRDVDVDAGMLTADWRDVVNDPDIDIVVELIGGITEAFDIVKAALLAGKPVVTGNKALLAERGAELFALSAQHDVPLYFEASCGGGIPIIQSLQNSLICNNVRSITGIINGTSNYILSSMSKGRVSFKDALAKAQELGFAEADPSFDVNGWDAAHKALILAMLAYGTPVDSSKISVHGIEKVDAVDFTFAKKLGYTIKLLVVIKHHEDTDALELRVQPSLVPQTHLLSSVKGVFNAIAVEGDIVGETIFYGRGAGKNPTASAVIGDVVLAMRECRHRGSHAGFSPYSKCLQVQPVGDSVTPYYVRFRVKDCPGVIASLASIFARYDMGISATNSIACPETETCTGCCNDLVLMIHACKWSRLMSAIHEASLLDSVAAEPLVLRIETFAH
ncbi:MAG: homoserine dehydrogenase [Akkermansia sp.]